MKNEKREGTLHLTSVIKKKTKTKTKNKTTTTTVPSMINDVKEKAFKRGSGYEKNKQTSYFFEVKK